MPRHGWHFSRQAPRLQELQALLGSTRINGRSRVVSASNSGGLSKRLGGPMSFSIQKRQASNSPNQRDSRRQKMPARGHPGHRSARHTSEAIWLGQVRTDRMAELPRSGCLVRRATLETNCADLPPARKPIRTNAEVGQGTSTGPLYGRKLDLGRRKLLPKDALAELSHSTGKCLDFGPRRRKNARPKQRSSDARPLVSPPGHR